MKNVAVITILIPLLLSGCATEKPRRIPVTPQPMSCAGNHPAQITLFSPEDAKLVFEEKTYELKRIQTPSGVKYGNRKVSYWNKGIDALITREDGSVTTCTYIPRSGL